MRSVSWEEFRQLCKNVATEIIHRPDFWDVSKCLAVWGVPRGGVYVALELVHALEALGRRAVVSYSAADADIIVDDLIDSGATAASFHGRPFYALFDKRGDEDYARDKEWYTFPWEVAENTTTGPEDAVRRLLQYIGVNLEEEDLKETPARVIRSYGELFAGYKQDPKELFTQFQSTCDEMVVLRNIEFYSTCEHHMLPFHGKAHVAYIPSGSVLGVSKLARLVEVFARRLQIQERIGDQVTSALMRYVQPNPLGAACVLEASHMCMTCRGVAKQHSTMATSSLRGAFKEDPKARAELFQLIRG